MAGILAVQAQRDGKDNAAMAETGKDNPSQRRIVPGSGRRRSPAFHKGRQPEAAARGEIAALLGDRPRDRDLLIEHLHLVQDTYGCLGAAHLQALAGEMRLSMAEVYEVASFYAHFDIVLDGEAPPPPVTVRVCDSLTCALSGADSLLQSLPGKLGAGVRVVRAPCMGRCDTAPVAEVGHRHVDNAGLDSIAATVQSGKHHPEIPEHIRFDAYVKDGGYTLLRGCLDGVRSVEDVIRSMEDSRLRGLGGAGFPAGRKWRFVRQEDGPRLMAVNADEGEPGTFKDRYHLERDPHRFLEGMLIAAWAVDVDAIYVYLRDDYPAIREILVEAIAELERS
jgi:formate dehydrogenase